MTMSLCRYLSAFGMDSKRRTWLQPPRGSARKNGPPCSFRKTGKHLAEQKIKMETFNSSAITFWEVFQKQETLVFSIKEQIDPEYPNEANRRVIIEPKYHHQVTYHTMWYFWAVKYYVTLSPFPNEPQCPLPPPACHLVSLFSSATYCKLPYVTRSFPSLALLT